MRIVPILAALAAATAACPVPANDVPAANPAREASATDPAALRHVASPDWRDQVIYFAMIDRFDDGDPSNNDQGAGEYDQADGSRWSGGDLRGLARRIDYIRGLGATALWITPPVANQWWDARVNFSGYHGYWAEDFMRVDAHYGGLEDYRALAQQLHDAGMYLVQDVVVNHVGNFFSYEGEFDPKRPQRNFRLNTDARPHPSPTQPPFDLNDVRRRADRDAAIYHWTPRIQNHDDEMQEQTWQLADLDDLNTRNPSVREALRRSYGYWIREVGVDAFRVDTAFHVEPDFYADFVHSTDSDAPGMLAQAARTGRDGFHLFGEGFGVDAAFDDRRARKLEKYVRAADGSPLLPAMINFPLHGSTLDVFARGRPSAVLGHRIRSMMQLHANPHLMPSFVDNHDVDRFLAGGSEAGLKQALLLILTLPGIPVIYYGTEQGFTEQRGAMFAAGYGSGGRDHFDPEAPLYRFLQRAIALRRAHPVLSRGVPQVSYENAAAPGAFAYRMMSKDGTLLVVFNSADHETLLADMDTGLAPGTRLQPLFSIAGDAAPRQVDADGRLTLALAGRSGQVWRSAGVDPLPDADARSGVLSLAPFAHARVSGALQLEGEARGVDAVQLVLDGDLSRALPVTPDEDGRWRASIDTASLIDPGITHSVVAWSPSSGRISHTRQFGVDREWQVMARESDPQGDDHGPEARYRYPPDPLWQQTRPLDLREVTLSASGGSLRIELKMQDLIAGWSPPNGFDHVALTLFIELPGRDGGARVMPLQNAMLPGTMRWHYRLRAGGWTNTLFSAAGASATQEGTAVIPAATLHADRERDTLTFILPADALGHPADLDGARVYVTTWDYDGGYRTLQPVAASNQFGGGDGSRDPLVMDDSRIITLQAAD